MTLKCCLGTKQQPTSRRLVCQRCRHFVWFMTERSKEGRALRDNTKNACVADYYWTGQTRNDGIYLFRTMGRKENNKLALCLTVQIFVSLIFVIFNCCGATEGSEQQHNQDLKEIYKGATNSRIHHFLPQCIAFNHIFYHNALHLTRVHCVTNNSNKNTGK